MEMDKLTELQREYWMRVYDAMTMDKLTELNREYWVRVVDMCEGTNVKPWECVRFKDSKKIFDTHPNFNYFTDQGINEIEFAVAILEGKPVFVGDVVYSKLDGCPLTMQKNLHPETFRTLSERFTWTPPSQKHIFTISVNGGPPVALPCPVNGIDDPVIYIRKGDDNGSYFQFYSVVDRDKVFNALINLLIEARDK